MLKVVAAVFLFILVTKCEMNSTDIDLKSQTSKDYIDGKSDGVNENITSYSIFDQDYFPKPCPQGQLWYINKCRIIRKGK